MAQYNYSTKMENEESISKAVGRDLSISTKQTIEVCNFIKEKKIDEARKILEMVISKKMAIPFKRFTRGAGHKKGAGPAKYPVSCCKEILRILNAAAANASFKGLNPSNMVISVLCPQKGAKRWHYGRQRRRKMKRTNLEIVLKEETEKKEKPKAKEMKKEKKKPEVKETKKEVPVAPKKEAVKKTVAEKPVEMKKEVEVKQEK